MVKVPMVEELWEYGEGLIREHGVRDALYDRLDAVYFQDRDEEEAAAAEAGVQRVTLPLGTNVVDLVVDLAAAQELSIGVVVHGEGRKEKREADEAERWIRGWLSLNERLGRLGNLRAQMAWHCAMRGMVVVRVLPVMGKVVGDVHMPMVVQVRDPRHVYVDWSGVGIRAVVEEWERSVGSIRREYPGVLVGKRYEDRDRVVWREYWDDRWCAYWADGEVVKVGGRAVRPHMYGGLPYWVALGRAAPLRDPGRMVRPLLVGVEKVVKNIETLASIMATASLQTVTAAFAVYSQRYGGEGKPGLDLRPGSLNYFDPTLGERVEPIQRAQLPADIFRLMEIFLAQFQQGTVPVALFGEVGGALAGYAINLMTQSGRRALLPIWRAIEGGHEGAIMIGMRLVRELVGPAYGGPLPLVLRGGGEERKGRGMVLDWERIGDDFDVECRLEDPMPADRAGNLRMALEAWRGGLLSRETALTLYNVVPDATEEMMRSFVEKVVEKNVEEEARRVAIERGYLEGDDKGGDGGGDKAGTAMDMGSLGGASHVGDLAGAPRGVGGIAALQDLSGMGTATPSLDELAGGPPAMPGPGG